MDLRRIQNLLVSCQVIAACSCACSCKGNEVHPKAQDAEVLDDAGKKRVSTEVQRALPARAEVWLYQDGRRRATTRSWALAHGYTILDLSDDWTPYIFSEKESEGAPSKPNSYRKIYIGLANDETDNWGKPLSPGKHNYLELFGISPSLSVLKKRFVEEQKMECFKKLDLSVFREKLPYAIRYTKDSNVFRFEKMYKARLLTMRRLMRRLKLTSTEELSASGRHGWEVKAFRKVERIYRALTEAQRRLKCERILKAGYRPGAMDWTTHLALKRFEWKNMIFGWGMIYKKTREALANTPLANNHAALIRMIRERIALTIPILEDGTVDTYKDSKGLTHRPPNLIRQFTEIAVRALGIETGEKAMAFLASLPNESKLRFRVAARFPPLPAYYSRNMELSVRILRGDVWYDFPYDAKGNETAQPRSMLPKLILFVHHGKEKIPLVKWGTTIGGWRTEMHDGFAYWKYKNSPVGWRQWKYVIAAPVWFPPLGTPPRDLIKNTRINGRWRTVVKREEMGPGYASAYGLVAAMHTHERTRQGSVEDLDHGIRTHGSVNYMSIMRYHSHGCHRLHNHLAVRLFSFILQRRKNNRLGQQYQNWTLPFTYNGKKYSVKLNTKGYYFEIDPPIPVFVTRGRIMGKTKEPITDFVRKADVRYPGHDGGKSPQAPSPDGSAPSSSPPSSSPPPPGSVPKALN